MPLLVRRGAFETNSSSSHSLVVPRPTDELHILDVLATGQVPSLFASYLHTSDGHIVLRLPGLDLGPQATLTVRGPVEKLRYLLSYTASSDAYLYCSIGSHSIEHVRQRLQEVVQLISGADSVEYPQEVDNNSLNDSHLDKLFDTTGTLLAFLLDDSAEIRVRGENTWA